jgi:hypothetical protein
MARARRKFVPKILEPLEPAPKDSEPYEQALAALARKLRPWLLMGGAPC